MAGVWTGEEDPTPEQVVEAIRQAEATSANGFPLDPESHTTLASRINRHMAALDHAEAVLRATFTAQELSRLTLLLVSMHEDSLDTFGDLTLDEFVHEL